MTEGLLAELEREAIGQAKEAAATEGYFAASVDVGVDRSTSPTTVTLHVVPGAQTHVTSVNLQVSGVTANDPDGEAAIAKLREEWLLPVGAPFRQSEWERAKARAVAMLAGNGYAAAKLTTSLAEVDPATSTAELRVDIDSGPAFHVGDLDITGLSRYPPELVRNYQTLKRGERYSITELDQFVRRLNGTGYFASVQAAIDTDPAHAADAPIRVGVIEAPPKKLEAGIGYSTDAAFRSNLSYRDVDFASRALQMSFDMRVESKLQNMSLRFVSPPAASGWSTAAFGNIERTDISGLVTQTGAAGLRMISLDERNQWQYGAAIFVDEQRPSGAASISSHALYVDVEHAWRRVDDLAAPTQGYNALLQLGGGIPGASTRSFGRVIGHFAAWWPLDRSWSLYTRAEAGAVLAASREGIPSTLLFRTGGDTTVRGYAFESLGVKQGDAIVPGRYYAVASLEATRWLNANLGVAAFVDAGNAFDSVSDLRAAVGYGVGARVRTPIGPLRLDLAYGEQSRQVRLHFSVGVTF
ncbi:MAG TPA: BamA/TamA family outer membrane protein [Casimicrobiaceae bacterium]|nr:BamA/TamA family outer membrane protein [Casimicrobiaceae bacterium]